MIFEEDFFMRKSRGVEKREWVTALRAVVFGNGGGAAMAVFLLAGSLLRIAFVHDEK